MARLARPYLFEIGQKKVNRTLPNHCPDDFHRAGATRPLVRILSPDFHDEVAPQWAGARKRDSASRFRPSTSFEAMGLSPVLNEKKSVIYSLDRQYSDAPLYNQPKTNPEHIAKRGPHELHTQLSTHSKK